MYKLLSSAIVVTALAVCIATTSTIVDRFGRTFSAHQMVAVNGALKSDRLAAPSTGQTSVVQVVERRQKADRSRVRLVQVAFRQHKADYFTYAVPRPTPTGNLLARAQPRLIAPTRTDRPEAHITVASIEPLVFVPVAGGYSGTSNVVSEAFAGTGSLGKD